MEVVASIMKDYIIELLKDGKRIDGRGLEDYRELEVKTNVIEKAEGSAWVKLGNTQVMVGIKADVGEPFPDLPNMGVMTTNVELVPLASPTFEPGPPDERSIELARVVDRGIRESQAIDLEKLVIVPGKLVRIIFIDVHVLDHDGNLVDAAGIGTMAALLSTKLPKIEYNEETGELVKLDEYEPLPVRKIPIPVSFAKIRDNLLVDPNLEEEHVMDGKITITTDENGYISAVQKSEGGSFKLEELMYAIDIASKRAGEIRKVVLDSLNKE
ncbi:MAG: exosome complex protein Rrp42 [Palaeococcus sp.]|uniref:exosome complex protein Rrp42 n=1 Tax=Palaeococcus sp. (in: euryarchaeotes) TaxID=2820298 RepID=UPI0025E53DE5|nr:exosome complex protein Rrp42 [Palaeococcus sp. (in: euryarchaeotes)]MCD6559331.1 exosome complex protein Rrp42 [Palaeococcus sp. (in: euryarchaeotes)]